MTERGTILAIGCDEEAIIMMTSCLERHCVDLEVVASQAELVRCVLSHPPVAVVVGVESGSDGGLDAIETLHALRGDLPVVVIANEDSIEIERRARQAGIFYYVVEPLQAEEIEAVVADVLRYEKES